MTTTTRPDVGSEDDSEGRELRLAAMNLQRARAALEKLAAEAPGRRAVYAAWARHLGDDWRGIALLAARADV